MTEQHQHSDYNDEIDLVELIANLWREKWTIAFAIASGLILGVGYLLITPPTYRASTQLEPPSAAELAPLNNTQIVTVNPGEAFADLLSILESDAHRAELVTKEKTLLASIYTIAEADLDLEAINFQSLYTINYPEPKREETSLEPNIYLLTSEGHNRDLLKTLLDRNISLATQQLLKQWKTTFEKSRSAKLNKANTDFERLTQAAKERRDNAITRLTEENLLQTKQLEDELAARKRYVLDNRANNIIELEEALKIATALGLNQPSSLSRLGTQLRSGQQVEVNTEINNQQDPLYLRGTKLLDAELENLKGLSNTTFLDTKIIELETELQKLKANRDIEILSTRESDVAFSDDLQSLRETIQRLTVTEFPENFTVDFQNAPTVAPLSPIKPKRMLILVVSILLGGVVGFFIAIARIVYNNHRIHTTIS